MLANGLVLRSCPTWLIVCWKCPKIRICTIRPTFTWCPCLTSTVKMKRPATASHFHDFFCWRCAGYEYSHTKNRMWRKTRSSGTTRCQGTDLNRNFGHRWGGKGQSRDPCSEIYSGKSAMSEPESQAVGNFIRSRVNQIKVCTLMYIRISSVLH